ncbi:MAG TPA: nicotinamide-nucleotide amidohydrolase family protein [Steroidobacteraceae bacterium]
MERAQSLVGELRRQRVTVVTAESCTGGLIAGLLSHAPRASECLHGGFVVYTKEHKQIALGVSRRVLDQNGSVNAEVARELAMGALARSPATLALAVTGVLGPDPDEDGNPPGRVIFSLARRDREPLVIEEHFGQAHPDAVRRAAILRALALLRETASA